MGLEDPNRLGMLVKSVHHGCQPACTYNEAGEAAWLFVLEILKKLKSFVKAALVMRHFLSDFF